jgi:transposase
MQADGLDAYPAAIAGTAISHAGCWAHERRRMIEAQKTNPESESAPAGLAWIGRLNAIERELREELDGKRFTKASFKPQHRQRVYPVLDDFRPWLDNEALARLPSLLAEEAIAYTLGHWSISFGIFSMPTSRRTKTSPRTRFGLSSWVARTS